MKFYNLHSQKELVNKNRSFECFCLFSLQVAFKMFLLELIDEDQAAVHGDGKFTCRLKVGGRTRLTAWAGRCREVVQSTRRSIVTNPVARVCAGICCQTWWMQRMHLLSPRTQHRSATSSSTVSQVNQMMSASNLLTPQVIWYYLPSLHE